MCVNVKYKNDEVYYVWLFKFKSGGTLPFYTQHPMYWLMTACVDWRTSALHTDDVNVEEALQKKKIIEIIRIPSNKTRWIFPNICTWGNCLIETIAYGNCGNMFLFCDEKSYLNKRTSDDLLIVINNIGILNHID